MIWDNVKEQLGTCWEQQKSNTLTLPKRKRRRKKKKPMRHWVHAASPHWLQESFLPTCVLCHSWPTLMTGA